MPPPCSLCRRVFSKGCQWCQGRKDRLRPPSAAERRAHAEQIRAAAITAEAVAAARRARLQRLAALGRPVRVGLVGCAKQKHVGTHPARYLYKSPLFRLALAYAERTCDEALILSARYEVVEPQTLLASYDCKLSRLDKQMLALWAARVSADLADRYNPLSVELVVLAGSEYIALLRLPETWRVVRPLHGLAVGERLHWLRIQMPTIR